MAALLVAVRRAACTLARRGRPGSLARCSVRGCSLPPGARPWLLRPGCAAASSGSAPAASSRRVGVVVRLRSRGPPPSCQLFAQPFVCVAPLVRARLARPVILCSASLRARGARLAPLARGGQQATPAGLASRARGAFRPGSRVWVCGRLRFAARPWALPRPVRPPLRRSPGPVGGGAARLILWPLRGWAVIGASSQTTPQTLAGQTPRRPRQQGYRAVMPPPARRHGIPIFAAPRK